MNILPTPKEQKLHGGAQTVCLAPSVERNMEFAGAVAAFQHYAQALCGLNVRTVENGATIRIKKVDTLVEEAYGLVIDADGVKISASEECGVNHAFATLLQLMSEKDGQIELPVIAVRDKPDTLYRGLMVDLARSWHPLSYLLSYVDMCYYYKLSVLHLHFTDDESYTLPSKLYPKLSTGGQSYTRGEIRALVEYARCRGVQLMPEIDVPGHCKSFQSEYGEVFGTKGVICQHETSIAAMKALFAELCDMFPYSKYIHIGGDEAHRKDEWTKCPACLAYARKVGIDTDMEDREMLAQQMYAHFITEMAQTCFDKGRQPIVWEGFSKAVNDRVSKKIWVISWENYYQITPDLLAAGFRIINCPWSPMYVVAPKCMWSPKEVLEQSIYRWRAVHPSSPYLNEAYDAPSDAAVLGGQLLAWGDHIVKDYPSVAEGVQDEWRILLERVPMLAEKTWNVQTARSYEAIEPTAGELQKKFMKL